MKYAFNTIVTLHLEIVHLVPLQIALEETQPKAPYIVSHHSLSYLSIASSLPLLVQDMFNNWSYFHTLQNYS
jgi:hypothetical protein